MLAEGPRPLLWIFTEAVAILYALAADAVKFVTICTDVFRYVGPGQLVVLDHLLFFTIGTHPHNAGSERDVAAAKLVALAQHPRCIAIGRRGLTITTTRARATCSGRSSGRTSSVRTSGSAADHSRP